MNENDNIEKNENYFKLKEHEIWLERQKSIRKNLDNIGLNLEYLKRKKDLTELEKRVLRRMMFLDKDTQTDGIVCI